MVDRKDLDGLFEGIDKILPLPEDYDQALKEVNERELQDPRSHRCVDEDEPQDLYGQYRPHRIG